jgi:23S rRNA (guanosine2251-2'-O)-methyltransferase
MARRMMGSDVVYGIHAVRSAVSRDAAAITEVWVQDQDARARGRLGELLTEIAAAGIAVRSKTRGDLEKALGDVRHQGIVALTAPSAPLPLVTEADLPSFVEGLSAPPLLLVLDGVQDPHNLGACLRTADGAGVQLVITPKDNAVGITPVVRKVASGAAEVIPLLQVTNLARTLRGLQDMGIWLVGADASPESASVYETDLSGPVALVLGAEGRGLRQKTRGLCDFLVEIPMAGSVSSLNVSVATGVLLYEAVRQRRPKT